MKPYHEFTTKYPINYYRKHESKCAPSWKHLPRPYRRCLYLRYISQIGAIKAHNAPATLTLLSFVNKLCKSSAVLGALVVAGIPAMVVLIGYQKVVELEVVVAEEVVLWSLTSNLVIRKPASDPMHTIAEFEKLDTFRHALPIFDTNAARVEALHPYPCGGICFGIWESEPPCCRVG
jgi:hypothetical protein